MSRNIAPRQDGRVLWLVGRWLGALGRAPPSVTAHNPGLEHVGARWSTPPAEKAAAGDLGEQLGVQEAGDGRGDLALIGGWNKKIWVNLSKSTWANTLR